MRAVSDRFLAAVRGSHKMRARAHVLTDYHEGSDPGGTEIPIMGGDVKLSANSDIRATLELVTDGSAWDYDPGDLLTPYGNEIYVERGIEFGDGSVEWVGLGYFRIYSVDQDDVPNGPIRISGRDRMSAVIDSKLEAPRQFTTGDTVNEVFQEMLTEVDLIANADGTTYYSGGPYQLLTIEFDDSLDTELLTVDVASDQDRFGLLRDLARANGKLLYFKWNGRLQVTDPPSPTTPVWTVNAGEYGVLVSMSRELSRDGIYNVVVVTGEDPATTTPVYASVRDNNPDSPTYYHGIFGPVATFYTSPLITTKSQAQIAAAALLQQSLGRPAAVDFSAIPNPGLEPGDLVYVNTTSSTEQHVIDDITIPLTPDGVLSCTTRVLLSQEFEGP